MMSNFMIDHAISETPLVKWCKTNTPASGFVLNTNDSDVYVRFNANDSSTFSGISVIVYPVFAGKFMPSVLSFSMFVFK